MYAKQLLILLFFAMGCSFYSFQTANPSEKEEALYSTLEKHSISQLLSFYSLFPNSSKGKEALEQAWQLLQKHRKVKEPLPELTDLPLLAIDAVVNLTIPTKDRSSPTLSPSQISLVEKIADFLGNRKLKGH